ncbi:hypothetical protein CSPB_0032 [Campylobacter sputorum subsp. bovis]|nr:hypothetical protein CSPB_0032 [Campylobacter sputorum]
MHFICEFIPLLLVISIILGIKANKVLRVKQQKFSFYYAIIGFLIMIVANIIAWVIVYINISEIIPMELLNSLYFDIMAKYGCFI